MLWQVCMAASYVGVCKHQPGNPQGRQRSVYAIWSREASESPPTDLRVLVWTSNTSTQRDCSRAQPSVSVRTCTQKLTWVIGDLATVLICSHSLRLAEYYFSILPYQKHHLLSLLLLLHVHQQERPWRSGCLE